MPGHNEREQVTAPAVHPVLYVDDEPALLAVCKAYFARRGDIAITGAESAKRAIELIKTNSYEVIISDYQMPAMNGIDLLKHLQQQNCTIPFILFTGQGREEIVIEAINNGATYYLQKGGAPRVTFTELEHKIREAIRRQTAEKALLESEARYRAVFENTGTAIIIIEDNMTIRLCNNEFLRLTGSRREEVEGKKTLADYIYHEDLPEVLDYHRSRRAERDQGPGLSDFRILSGTGSILSVRATAEYIPGTAKSVISLINITEQKNLIQELKKKDDEIRILYACLAGENKQAGISDAPVAKPNFQEIMGQIYSQKTDISNPEKFRPIMMWEMLHPPPDS